MSRNLGGSLFDAALSAGGMETPGVDPQVLAASKTLQATMALEGLYRINAASGAVTVTLPAAAAVFAAFGGALLRFKKIDSSANAMTVRAAGSELIDAANTLSSTTQYAAYGLMCNGTGWDIVARY